MSKLEEAWHVIEETSGLSVARSGDTINEAMGMFKLRVMTIKLGKILKAIKQAPKVMDLPVFDDK